MTDKESWCTHLLILHEERDVLVDPLLDGDGVVVPDGILTEEVELDDEGLPVLLLVQRDVLHPQRAAAHRVRLVLVLLVASPRVGVE